MVNTVPYYTLTTEAAAGSEAPPAGTAGAEQRRITADPRLLRPSQLLSDPPLTVPSILGLTGGGSRGTRYCLARLSPRGPVATGSDFYAECAGGWRIDGAEAIDDLLGPQAGQIIDAVRAAEPVFTAAADRRAAAYAAAVDAVCPFRYEAAHAAAAQALDKRGADGWWYLQGFPSGYGPEITALAARDLIGTTPAWTREEYDLLTGPWAAAFGVPIHPGDTAMGSGAALIATVAPDGDYAATYQRFWKNRVERPDGSLDPDRVQRELHDYSLLLDEVPRAYDLVTSGRFTKPLTRARHIAEAVEQRIAAAVAEALTEQAEVAPTIPVPQRGGDAGEPDSAAAVIAVYTSPDGSPQPVSVIFTQDGEQARLRICPPAAAPFTVSWATDPAAGWTSAGAPPEPAVAVQASEPGPAAGTVR